MSKSYSSSDTLSLVAKVREASQLLALSIASSHDVSSIFDDIKEYEDVLKKYDAPPLASSRVLELGYGPRPMRLLALSSLGVDVFGVDRDRPHLNGGIGSVLATIRENGIERGLKNAVRSLISDPRHYKSLDQALECRGARLKVERRRMLVRDLTEVGSLDGICPGLFDVAFSEDVMEHVPEAGLPILMRNLQQSLKPGGLALLRPNVFTGITGGHLVEWYPNAVDESGDKRSEPWEHLRKRRFSPNTFLNELPRRAYRELFSDFFDVLEERVDQPNLGRRLLTPTVKAELSGYDDEELFSNRILWVLRKRT
jgi:hypothetical protein